MMGFLASALIWKRCQTGLAARWQYIRFFIVLFFVFSVFSVVLCEDAAELVAMTNSKVFALETERQRQSGGTNWNSRLGGLVLLVPQFKYQPVITSSHPKLVFFSMSLPDWVGSQARNSGRHHAAAARMSQECFPHLSWLCVTKNSDVLGSKLRQIKLALKVNHRIYFVYRCFFQSGCYLSFSACACWGGGSFLSYVHPLAECNAVCFSASVLVVSRFSPSHRPTSPPPLKISTARDGLHAASCKHNGECRALF